MAGRVFLIDGTAMAYRAHFAFERAGLTDAAGRPTGAAFGFLRQLQRVLRQERPTHLAVAFDGPEKTFRHERYPDYKATRDKTPDDLVAQIPDIEALVKALNLPFLVEAGWEADDLIGALAIKAAAAGHEVFIVTADKDFAQLVDDRIRMASFPKGADALDLIGPSEVEEKWGVPPDRIRDLLALMGDASDNVPGVPGVGPKTAVKLIHEHGGLEDVLGAADGMPASKLRDRLIDHAEDARLSYELVTIGDAAPVPEGLEPLSVGEPDLDALREVLTRLEFHAIIDEYDLGGGEAADSSAWACIDSDEQLRELVARLEACGDAGFAFDTEATSADAHTAEIVGASFSWADGEAAYVPFNAAPCLMGGRDALIETLRGPLENAAIPKCAQNGKYDVTLLAQTCGIDVTPLTFDTMVAHYVLHPTGRRHGLDAMALEVLSVQKIPTTDVIGKGKAQVTMAEVAIPVVAEYACEDADVTWRLRGIFEHQLDESGNRALFETLEMPLVPVLTTMEHNGIRLLPAPLAALSKEAGQSLEGLTDEIHRIAGHDFNIASTQQLQVVLYEELKVHEECGFKPRKTKTGFSTDATALDAMAEHPLCAALLEHRGLAKLKSTYLDPLPLLIKERTGRLHTSFSQVSAATGRLASSDPNLQNIPIRTEMGARIREAFVAEDGWRLLSADYSQVELRVMAHLSGDEQLCAFFAEGADIHVRTAALVGGVDPGDVTPEMRSRAKAVNFGLIYGMGAQRLARDWDMSVKEAKAFIERYFETFPAVRVWLDRTVEQAREHLFVETIMGRRREIPEIAGKDPRARAFAENAAVNTPVQGSAADIIKRAMIDLHASMAEAGVKSRLLLQVHDELLLEAPPEEEEQMEAMVVAAMQNAADLAVPLTVDTGWGAHWREAH